MTWFEQTLKNAAGNPTIRTVVVGMHAALPDSIAAGHSMNDSPAQTDSGRRVYQDLVAFRDASHKYVYVLASHAHFFMGNIYNTACRRASKAATLPGCIAGSAGAVPYRLPQDVEG